MHAAGPVVLNFYFAVAKVVAKVPFSPGHEMVGEVRNLVYIKCLANSVISDSSSWS